MMTVRMVVFNNDECVDIMEIDRDVLTREAILAMGEEFARCRMAREEQPYTRIEYEFPS